MFSGLVEETGRVLARSGSRLRIGASLVVEDTAVGDSISVSGCCVTAVAVGEGWWEADLSAETLAVTTLAALAPGDPVNLERALRLGDRLGGHLVAGHVDGVAEVIEPAPDLVVQVPAHLSRYLVPKGSITLDGVSLTVASVAGDRVAMAVIPHTASATTLGELKPGDALNVEVDVLARYVEVRLGER